MKAKIIVLNLIAVFGFMFGACVTSIPVTSNINDFVMMGIKTNKTENVSLELVSNIHDGKYIVLNQKGEDSGAKESFLESTTLQKMIKEYFSSKFSKLSETGDTKIKITVNDFSFSYYVTESTGMQVLRAFAGSAAGTPCVIAAKISVTVDINRNGSEEIKNIIATSEESFIVGTGQVYAKEAADCVNSANNKVLMLLNSYFEELQL